MPIAPELRRLKQEDHHKTSLGYRMRPCLKQTENIKGESCQAWWFVPRIPVCRRLKQEEYSSDRARLGYEVKAFSNNN